MSLKHYVSLIAVTLVAMTMADSVSAQQNMGQAFAPVSYDEFGGGKRANEGWFADYSGLWWYVPAADSAVIGSQINQETWVWNTANYGTPELDVAADATEPTVFPTGILESNGLQSSYTSNNGFDSKWSIGQRIIGGAVFGHHGFDVGYMYLNTHSQTYEVDNMWFVLEQKGDVGGYPVLTPQGWITLYKNGATGAQDNKYPSAVTTFDTARMKSWNDFWSVNADYIYRIHPGALGFITELNFGGRYTEFNEGFSMIGEGGWLHNSTFSALAKNSLAGPSVGFRISRNVKQWGFTAQAGYTAAFNTRSVDLTGHINNLLDDPRVSWDPATGEITESETAEGDTDDNNDDSDTDNENFQEGAREYLKDEANELPTDITNLDAYNALNAPRPEAFRSGTVNDFRRDQNEYCTMIDWRFDVSYQVTKMISLNAGYSGMWINDIVRPASQINYVVGSDGYLEVKDEFKLEDLFLNGVDFGITLNR